MHAHEGRAAAAAVVGALAQRRVEPLDVAREVVEVDKVDREEEARRERVVEAVAAADVLERRHGYVVDDAAARGLRVGPHAEARTALARRLPLHGAARDVRQEDLRMGGTESDHARRASKERGRGRESESE